MRYEDGTVPQILDIVVVPLARAEPHQHQQENHVIDPTYYWTKTGTMEWTNVQGAIEHANGPLWVNGHSSSNGLNDRVPEDQCDQFKRSLYLVAPAQLTLVVGTETNPFGTRRRVRADFDLSGHSYSLSMTDPVVEQVYFHRGDGNYSVANALLCVSLGEAFHGHAYKLAAAVITNAEPEQ
ncbi:MAG: hypothetical protein E6J00_05735 [Chloroflexi bacterium]|nr:MAG: hypothetical protein E6J00_05735 [Chloroflexota bacterium]